MEEKIPKEITMVPCGCTLRTFRVWHALPNTSPPPTYYVKRLHTWRNFRERLFARNFARRTFCEKDILREILREKNLILLSRTYVRLVIDSNLQIRAFSHHKSIDSSHMILSIFLNLLIQFSKSVESSINQFESIQLIE